MKDRVTANLPCADFDRTSAFYAALDFHVRYRDDGWMILERGPLEIEFFHYEADPYASYFSACIRVDDLDGLFTAFQKAELTDDPRSIPRLTPPTSIKGLRMFALVDPDGNLLRCIENR